MSSRPARQPARAQRARTTCAACACALGAIAGHARAQAPPRPSVFGTVRCDGKRVSEIVVYASAPTVAGARKVPVLRDVVRTMHVTTDPALTRRYLLLGEGSTCSELARQESERVLRAQPFIADASVVAYDDGADGVRLEVHTIDETSLLAGARMSGYSPYLGRLRLGSGNFMGQGLLLSGEWRSGGGGHRDGYALSIADYQLLGRRWVASLDMKRDLLGGAWRSEISRPFLTDLQRAAWRVQGSEASRYVRIEKHGEPTRAINVYRSSADAGVLSRIGPPRRLALLGLTLSHERERTGREVLFVDRLGSRADTAPLGKEFEPHTMARANLLGGVRVLDFVRVQGFDGLSATQDLPVGVQAGIVAGRSLPALGTVDDDWFSAFDLYAARGNTSRATRVQLTGEGRYDRARTRWDGVVAAGGITHYEKAGERNTTILSAEWAGIWHPRVPGWLPLGSPDGGMRGFANAHEIGSRRAVARVEQRRVLGRVNGTVEFGGALFVDAGRVWAGEVPYGMTTPWRTAYGVSVLAALPVRSARLWRVDVAIPSTGGGIRQWEVRVARSVPLTPSGEHNQGVDQMRSGGVSGSVFRWP